MHREHAQCTPRFLLFPYALHDFCVRRLYVWRQTSCISSVEATLIAEVRQEGARGKLVIRAGCTRNEALGRMQVEDKDELIT